MRAPCAYADNSAEIDAMLRLSAASSRRRLFARRDDARR